MFSTSAVPTFLCLHFPHFRALPLFLHDDSLICSFSQKSQPEYAVMHALVTKRKGLSIKSRMLILTSKARLLYFDPQGTYKGAVPWSVTKPISTHLVRIART